MGSINHESSHQIYPSFWKVDTVFKFSTTSFMSILRVRKICRHWTMDISIVIGDDLMEGLILG